MMMMTNAINRNKCSNAESAHNQPLKMKISAKKTSRTIPAIWGINMTMITNGDDDDGHAMYWRKAYCIGYTAICSEKSIRNGFPIRKGTKSSSQLLILVMIDDDDKGEYNDDYDDAYDDDDMVMMMMLMI